QTEVAPQGVDVIGDETEVLGHHRQIGMLGGERLEERVTGRGTPVAFAGGAGAGGHGPVGGEPAEVVDAHEVEAAQLMIQTRAPELKAIALRLLPVVEWIAPQLAIGGEVIRGTPASSAGRPSG